MLCFVLLMRGPLSVRLMGRHRRGSAPMFIEPTSPGLLYFWPLLAEWALDKIQMPRRDHFPLKHHHPALKTRAWQAPSFLRLLTSFFGLKTCSKAPAGVGLHNPREDGPYPHNLPSPFAPRSTSFAGKKAAGCLVRGHHVFERCRANPPRPRS